LVISVFTAMDYDYTMVIKNTFKDPFWLGAFVIGLAWAISYKNNSVFIQGINITHAAMTFFIITKIISQVEHGGHFGPWGKIKSH
jgi:hypothetical protein